METVRPVTIVILTWNGLDYTRRCLESIRSHTSHPDFHLVVVDNGSTDGTREFLEEQSFLKAICGTENLGFAKGNNIGIRDTPPGHDIVLLNNDTEITQPDWLMQMQRTAYASDDTGPVGCRLVRPSGMLQHAGAYMPLETFWG